MKSEKKIAIIGGGIGGLTMALTLKRNDVPFKLFEKSTEFKEVGAGIGISSNALKIFDKLNIGNKIREKGYLIKRTILATNTLKTLKEIPFPEEVYCIHRASLIDVLSSQLKKDDYELNKEVKNVENLERVKIEFQDKTQEEFETLIASDGINSVIRKWIFPKIKIRRAQQIIWRGIIDYKVDATLAHSYYELFGGDSRFLFLPLSSDKIFWLAVQEEKNYTKFPSKSLKSYLLNTFKEYDEIVLNMIRKTSEEKIIQNELSDLKPNKEKWFNNNTVFIGDSIHATTPNLGQGACQAVESAYTLGMCLKKYPKKKVFAAYQKKRIGKVKYIVRSSLKIGKMSLTNNKYQTRFLHIMLKFLPQSYYQKRFKRILDIKYLADL